MKTCYSIKALDESVAEISVFDEIGFWGVQAKDFAREVKAIAAPTIKLYINSPGGSVFDAITMVNALRQTGKTIEAHVLGIAASAASYLAMAGDKIVMPENTFMFLHNPINGVHGNAEDMREMADVLDKIGASLTATYAKRFKGDAKALADILAAETYLNAAECLEYGLCDEVTEAITATAKFDADHVPEAVRAVAFKPAAVEPEPVVVEPVVEPAVVAPSASAFIETALAAAPELAEFAAVFAADVSLVDQASVQAAVANAIEIRAFCAMTGMPDKAPAMIRARTSVVEARKALHAALVSADETSAIDTAPASKSKPLSSPAAKVPVTTASIWASARKR